jgi:Haem-degrading
MVKVAPAWLKFGSKRFQFRGPAPGEHPGFPRSYANTWREPYENYPQNASVGATFDFASSAERAWALTQDQGDKIASQCQAAANFVNNDPVLKKLVLFRPKTGKGAWWCAVTDREGTLLAIRSSDTNEDGCDKTEFDSDAARLSELIAIAKAWTTSFSNSEVAVDSRAVGLNSRIDNTGTFGNTTGTNAGPGALWGVWATNLLRHTDRANGYTCGKRHFGVVAFAGGVPVYKCKSGKLIGGAGASGDSVDADDAVTRKAIALAGFCTSP